MYPSQTTKIYRKSDETDLQYLIRVLNSSNFMSHNDNAIYDLTIDNALRINDGIGMQKNVYYFSVCGDATHPPGEAPTLYMKSVTTLVEISQVSIKVVPLCGAATAVSEYTQLPLPPSNSGETFVPAAFAAATSSALPFASSSRNSRVVAPPKLCPKIFIFIIQRLPMIEKD